MIFRHWDEYEMIHQCCQKYGPTNGYRLLMCMTVWTNLLYYYLAVVCFGHWRSLPSSKLVLAISTRIPRTLTNGPHVKDVELHSWSTRLADAPQRSRACFVRTTIATSFLFGVVWSLSLSFVGYMRTWKSERGSSEAIPGCLGGIASHPGKNAHGLTLAFSFVTYWFVQVRRHSMVRANPAPARHPVNRDKPLKRLSIPR